MEPDTIQMSLAIFAACFWVPVGMLLVLKRHAVECLADVEAGESQHLPRISIVIPARNEERNLEHALQSVLRLDYPHLEIVAVNDQSTDRTREILDKLAQRDQRLTVLTLESLPEGWLGKPYALHRGAQRAQGEFILFTDADIMFHPLALRKAMGHVQANRLDHLTIIPEDTMPGFFLRVLSATFGIFMFITFQPWNARNPKSPRYMGIGAFNLVRTAVYRSIGGHEAISLRPDDDLKFGKLVKRNGYRQDVMNGKGMIAVEWYRSVPELIHGLMKNMFAGMEYRVSVVILATIGSLLIHIWPWIGVWVATGWAQTLFALTVFVMAGSFGAVMAPFGVKPWHGVFLLPLTISLLVYIQCRAMVLTLWRGGIEWRGRFYSLERLRTNRL